MEKAATTEKREVKTVVNAANGLNLRKVPHGDVIAILSPGTAVKVVKEEGEYVYVADGRLRLLEKPKRKNKKHVQPICYSNELVPDIKYNEDIKRVIKLFCAGAVCNVGTRE